MRGDEDARAARAVLRHRPDGDPSFARRGAWSSSRPPTRGRRGAGIPFSSFCTTGTATAARSNAGASRRTSPRAWPTDVSRSSSSSRRERRGSWFSDSADGKRRWEEFLTGDLLRAIEARYRVVPGRKGRAASPASRWAATAPSRSRMKHPDLFGSVSSLSGALIPIRLGGPSTLRLGHAAHVEARLRQASRSATPLAANDVWDILQSVALREPALRGSPARGHRGFLRTRRRRGAVRDVPERARRFRRTSCSSRAATTGTTGGARSSRSASGTRNGSRMMRNALSGEGMTTNGARLVLFDIDGTLLSAGRAARDSILAALELGSRLEGVRRRERLLGKDGPPDPARARRRVRRRATASTRRLREVLDRYVEELASACGPTPSSRSPASRRSSSGSRAEPRVVLGLLTGNIERGARLKLEPPDFNRYFPFGAFGDDSADRYCLPAVAVARARERTGRDFPAASVVIVGDSVHDVGVRAIPRRPDDRGRDRPDARGKARGRAAGRALLRLLGRRRGRRGDPGMTVRAGRLLFAASAVALLRRSAPSVRARAGRRGARSLRSAARRPPLDRDPRGLAGGASRSSRSCPARRSMRTEPRRSTSFPPCAWRFRTRDGRSRPSSATSPRLSTRRRRASVFDLHSIRAGRPRWEALLAAVPSREADLARMAAERAAALLPGGAAGLRAAAGLSHVRARGARGPPRGHRARRQRGDDRRPRPRARRRRRRVGREPDREGRPAHRGGGLPAGVADVSGGESRVDAPRHVARPARAAPPDRRASTGRRRSSTWTKTSFRSRSG